MQGKYFGEGGIRTRLPKHVILRQISIYQYFSAFLTTNQDAQKTSDKDRYYPICSDKDIEKVTKWGNQKGNQISHGYFHTRKHVSDLSNFNFICYIVSTGIVPDKKMNYSLSLGRRPFIIGEGIFFDSLRGDNEKAGIYFEVF